MTEREAPKFSDRVPLLAFIGIFVIASVIFVVATNADPPASERAVPGALPSPGGSQGNTGGGGNDGGAFARRYPGLDKWQGQSGQIYRDNVDICAVYTVKEVAAEYGVAADPVSAAQAASLDYDGRYQQPAFEGCLQGFDLQS